MKLPILHIFSSQVFFTLFWNIVLKFWYDPAVARDSETILIVLKLSVKCFYKEAY